MYFLEIESEITNINIVSVKDSNDILSDLETALDTEYSLQFPYGVFDVEILCKEENLIEILIEHEDSEGRMVKTPAKVVEV